MNTQTVCTLLLSMLRFITVTRQEIKKATEKDDAERDAGNTDSMELNILVG